MIPELLSSYDHTLSVLERAVHDLTPKQWVEQPTNVPNHPAWTIGHLTHSCEAIGGELSLVAWLPREWSSLFGTGSTPSADAAFYPEPHELRAALADGRERLGARLEEIGESGLAIPLPDERYRPIFPTLGHAVLHILCAHTAVHAGQLMQWRRAMGLSTEPIL